MGTVLSNFVANIVTHAISAILHLLVQFYLILSSDISLETSLKDVFPASYHLTGLSILSCQVTCRWKRLSKTFPTISLDRIKQNRNEISKKKISRAKMAVFVGTWERVKSENMMEYMKSIGIPEDFVKSAMEQKETFTIGRDGEKWTTRYVTGDKEENGSFTVGEPHDYMTVLGSMCTGTILSVDDNKMTESHVMGPLTMDVLREMEGDQMVVTTTTNGVSFKAWMKKV